MLMHKISVSKSKKDELKKTKEELDEDIRLLETELEFIRSDSRYALDDISERQYRLVDLKGIRRNLYGNSTQAL